jgi:hypothetical protein
MPSLLFRLKKRADAAAQLTLVREDGTRTTGPVGSAEGYFPVHDLTHYAIEQTLGLSEGFLGLVASGWEIGDFEVKGTAKRLSHETIFAEIAAGELSRQILTRDPSSLQDFLWAIDLTIQQHSPGPGRPSISESQFAVIRELISTEWRRWRELPASGTLELTFTSRRTATLPPPTVDERKRGALAAR